MASSRADTDNFQYSDADFKNNLNDNYINQVISTNLKNCVYTNFLNFDSRVGAFNSLFMLHFNIRFLQKDFDTFIKLCSCFRLFPKLLEFPGQKLMMLLLLIFLYLIIRFLHANSTTRAGGIGLCILSSISYNLLGKNQLSSVGCEDL